VVEILLIPGSLKGKESFENKFASTSPSLYKFRLPAIVRKKLLKVSATFS
jgi:hypothetical protein